MNALLDMHLAQFTRQEILSTLDNLDEYSFFPDLEHGYCFTSGSRINLYADETRWAIVFEKTGYGNRSGRVDIEVNYFGNCLSNLDKAGLNDVFTCNTKYFDLIDGEEFSRIETGFELVNPKIETITVRDSSLNIEQNIERYHRKEIYPDDYDNPDMLIDFASLIRYLDQENPELFRATNEELRTCTPNELPLVLTIDHWHHQPYSSFGGTTPSSYETFQLIAEVLVCRDPKKWKPTLLANNDWRNWSNAGGL